MLSNGEEIVAEIPIEHLAIYEQYNRIGKVIQLGGQCKCCLKVTRHILLIKCNGNKRSGTRFALYTEDWVELTIDHIKPRYMGGKDIMSNYQVLCLFCNRTKGSANISIEELREKIVNLTKGIRN